MSALNVVSGVFGLVLVALYAFVTDSFHHIEEGHVGVYWRGGALQDGTTQPGYHFKYPFIDRVANVQVTMQTDSVTEIPCGTSGGVMVYFDRIEVVNRLRAEKVHTTMKEYGVNYDKMWIFDKIHHEINQFCSSHTLREVFIELFDTLDENLAKALQTDCDKHNTGIDVITVRVTKPRIPESVRRSYELIEAERANLILAQEKQKVTEKNDEIYFRGEKTKADAAFYHASKVAEANALKFTRDYLLHTLYTSIANNTKIYFGDSIPKMFSDIGAQVPMGTAAPTKTPASSP